MKKHRYFWLTLVAAILMFLLIAGCSSDFYNKTLTRSGDTATEDYVKVVQNGYLGEYTDITVQDLLGGHYSLLYDQETWDGGTTDSGKEIVEVKYQDSNGDWDDVTIQFTMLDEQRFEVSAFVDPLEPLEKNTDILAALNYIYFEQYAIQNEAQVGNLEFELALIERLDQISSSAVLYGASSEYSGDRSQLCALAGDSPVDVSVPWLLDNYGLLDMSFYYLNEADDLSNSENVEDYYGRYILENGLSLELSTPQSTGDFFFVIENGPNLQAWIMSDVFLDIPYEYGDGNYFLFYFENNSLWLECGDAKYTSAERLVPETTYGTTNSSGNLEAEQELLYQLMEEQTASLYWYEDSLTGAYMEDLSGIYIEITAYCDDHGGESYYLSYWTQTDSGKALQFNAIPSCSSNFDFNNMRQSVLFDLSPYFSEYDGMIEIAKDSMGYSLWAEVDGCTDTNGTYVLLRDLNA